MSAPTPDPRPSLRFTVIVPFLNEERLIERCIRALLDQDFAPERFEVLMIDNNSTDGSADRVRRYPQVRLVAEAEQGRYAARNRGVLEARGEILAFTDADAAPSPDWLRTIDEAMRDDRIQVVVGRNHYAPGSAALALLEAYEDEKMRCVLSTSSADQYIAYGCNMALRASAVREAGPFVSIPRGSDVVMVRKIMESHPPESVVYGPDVRVVRMEIASVWTYFQKAYRYGADYRTYRHFAALAPLEFHDRLDIARATIRRHRYSVPKRMLLWGLLVTGAGIYELARRFGR